MDRVQARHDLAPGLFGALGDTERSALEAHPEQCGPCRAEQEEPGELLPLLGLVQPSGPTEAPVPYPPVPDPQRAVDAVRAEAAGRPGTRP